MALASKNTAMNFNRFGPVQQKFIRATVAYFTNIGAFNAKFATNSESEAFYAEQKKILRVNLDALQNAKEGIPDDDDRYADFLSGHEYAAKNAITTDWNAKYESLGPPPDVDDDFLSEEEKEIFNSS